jgi:DNA-binding NarL/FixJ family response regulator
VVVEIQMPLASGLATIAALRADYPGLRIVVCTFHGDSSTREQAAAAGADAYLLKPVNARDLRRALQSFPGPADAVMPNARASPALR